MAVMDRPSGKDFENWYNWVLNRIGYLDRFAAQKLYDEAYFCDCESCQYRKEHGAVPHRAGTHCRLPIDATSQLEVKVRSAIASA